MKEGTTESGAEWPRARGPGCASSLCWRLCSCTGKYACLYYTRNTDTASLTLRFQGASPTCFTFFMSAWDIYWFKLDEEEENQQHIKLVNPHFKKWCLTRRGLRVFSSKLPRQLVHVKRKNKSCHCLIKWKQFLLSSFEWTNTWEELLVHSWHLILGWETDYAKQRHVTYWLNYISCISP